MAVEWVDDDGKGADGSYNSTSSLRRGGMVTVLAKVYSEVVQVDHLLFLDGET